MNAYSGQEIRYNFIKILSRANNLTQRDMAVKMGISLGKVNYCISELGKQEGRHTRSRSPGWNTKDFLNTFID